MKIRLAAFTLALAMMLGTGRAFATTIVQQPDSTADLIGTEVVLQAGLDRETPQQNGLAALVAQSILLTPVSGGATLQDAVNANGGSISYVVEPRDVRFYLEGLTKSYTTLLGFFQSALSKPDFSPKTLDAARTALNAKIADNQRLALNVGIDMLNQAFYQDSDAGMPPYGIPATLAGFVGTDTQSFYGAHYRQDEAVVSVVGNLQALNGNVYGNVVAGLPHGTSAPVSIRLPQLPSSSREIIARRDVPVPWLVAQYPAPDIHSRDFGAMLILTSFMERTLADVSGIPAIATHSATSRGVGAYYNFDTHPANLIIYVDGGLGDPTRTFATALTVVNVLGHAKLGGNLNDMKSFAAGRLLEDTSTLQDQAWMAGVFASSHITGDYMSQALRAINSTTTEDLQRVAARYLNVPTIALVLPRAQQTVQSPTP